MNPRLALYIKRVSVCSGLTETNVVVEDIFTAIAALLVNVEELVLLRFRFWKENHGPAALAALVYGFPNLRTLEFYLTAGHNSRELATVLSAHSQLHSFSIICALPSGSADEDRPLSESLEKIYRMHHGSTLRLRTLKWARGLRNYTSHFRCLPGLTSYYADMEIDTMEMAVQNDTIPFVRDVLSRVGTSLQRLHLDLVMAEGPWDGEHIIFH